MPNLTKIIDETISTAEAKQDKTGKVRGAEHPDLFYMYRHNAEIMEKVGSHEKAASLYKQAYNAAKLGDDPDDAAHIAHSLVRNLLRTGNNTEAERIAKENDIDLTRRQFRAWKK